MEPKTTRLRSDGSGIGDLVIAHFLVRITLREGISAEIPSVAEIRESVGAAMIDEGYVPYVEVEQTDGDR